MAKSITPKKWTDVYPAGTKEGNEESRFFKALARNPKYQWRSTGMIAHEANLSKKRTEEIINKYLPKGLIFQSSKRDDHWAYWERVPEMLKKNTKSIAQSDKDNRINKVSSEKWVANNWNKLVHVDIAKYIDHVSKCIDSYFPSQQVVHLKVGDSRKTFYPYGQSTLNLKK